MAGDVNEPAYVPIAEYGIIGDCHTAALVSRRGSIDWLCWPRFDSSSVFCALLDANEGGRYWVRPAAAGSTSRRYLEDTAVLETTFSTSSGVLRLRDLMPMAAEQHHEVLRVLECIDGEVDVELRCEPRLDYGRHPVQVSDHGRHGSWLCGGECTLVIHGDVPLRPGRDGRWVEWHGRLHKGERRRVSLSLVEHPHVRPRPLGEHADRRVRETVRWWQEWAGRRTYAGHYRDVVIRSAITLRLLTFVPTGALVAAPTTSLPEIIGGARNWDYRLCWIRDASLTVQALYDLGCTEEVDGFLSWLLQTAGKMSHDLHVVYDLDGRECEDEHELSHLEGYRGSRPVRVGNAAGQQLQLDIYGEVIDTVYEVVLREEQLDGPTAELLLSLGRIVCERWQEPDQGIWEIRGERRHHTHSKLMCWVALDRILTLHARGYMRAPTSVFEAVREEIRRCVEEQGFNEALASYTTVLGGDEVDASLLLLMRYGFHDPDHPRALGTYELVEQRLSAGPLLHRYRSLDDGLSGCEGAFGICGYWAVEALARQGRIRAATERFEALVSLANDLGLQAEEFDPRTGAMLGNFPQAFTHVGLLDAALALEEMQHQRVPPPEGTSRARRGCAGRQTRV